MPTNLQDLYDKSTSDQMKRVKIQASGEARAPSALGSYPPNNFMEDTYQAEFKSRGAGDKNISQSQLDDATDGTFKDNALNFYAKLAVDVKLIQYRSQLVHFYNARNSSTYYSTVRAASPGVLSRY